MDSSDEKALMESLDPVIVELLDRLRERLDNKSKLMLYQEGYIDKQSHEIKSLKSDKYQKPKYQKKLKEAFKNMSSKKIELFEDYIEELIKSAEEFGAASSIAKIGEYKGWEVNLQISKTLPKGN